MAAGSSLTLCTLVSMTKSGRDINHMAEYQRSARALIIMIANRRWLLYEIATVSCVGTGIKNIRMVFILVEPLTLITVKSLPCIILIFSGFTNLPVVSTSTAPLTLVIYS